MKKLPVGFEEAYELYQPEEKKELLPRAYYEKLLEPYVLPADKKAYLDNALDAIEKDDKVLSFSNFFVWDMCSVRNKYDIAHGHCQRGAGIQNGLHGFGGKQGYIHRGEEHLVALVQQVGKSDFHRVKHLGGFVIFISQEDNAVTCQMPLQHGGIVTGDHDNFTDTGLAQGGHHPLGNGDGADTQHGLHHPLGNGDGADTQHGLEFSHSFGHTCGNDQRANLHNNILLKLQTKASCN